MQSLKALLNKVRAVRGQTMVLFALFLPGLIGMLGLGVDAAHLFNARRDIQSAADLAALAGASQLPTDIAAAKSIASDVAAKNGFDTGVTVTAPYDDDDNKIEVLITNDVSLFFMPVLGLSNVNVSARSVASHEINAGTAVLAKKDYHCWQGTVTWNGNNITVDGDVHSNGGLTVRGSNNTINDGKLTFKSGQPVYPLDGETDCGFENEITGSNPNIEIASSQWVDWPVFYGASDFPCTYNLGSDGDLERDGPWWQGGTMWPDKKLNPGVICVSGNNWLTLNEDNVSGNVTFVGGRFDIRGSNLNFTAYANGVLFASKSTSFPAMRLYPSGGSWEGMIYNRRWDSNHYIEGGQIYLHGSSGFQHTGTIVGWAVYLDGSGWSLFGTEEATYEPMRLVE